MISRDSRGRYSQRPAYSKRFSRVNAKAAAQMEGNYYVEGLHATYLPAPRDGAEGPYQRLEAERIARQRREAAGVQW